jgi:hypothetical protein
MKKSKYIEDHDSKQYKKQLREHMQLINPKPSPEVLEKLLQKYMDARGNK